MKQYPIVQLFESARFLGPNGKNDVRRHDYSFAYSIHHNKPIDSRRYKEWYPHPGYAWAMRRIAFEMINGLCEIAILGSGDLHFAYALLDRVNETLSNELSNDYHEQVKSWAARVAQIADKGRNVGYAPLHIYHHWHGDRNDRGYVERWKILEKYRYTPSTDLEKNPETGIIGLANKRQTDKVQMSPRLINLEKDIVAYFRSRNEDQKPVVHSSTPSSSSSKISTHHSYTSTSHIYHQNTHWIDCTCSHGWGHHAGCPCYTHYTDSSYHHIEPVFPDNYDENQEDQHEEDEENPIPDENDNENDNDPDDDGDNNEGPDEDVEPGSFY